MVVLIIGRTVAQLESSVLAGFDNRRRAFIIASFMALTAALSLVGLFPWQPPLILLVWFGVIKGTGRLLRTRTLARRARSIATAGFCADTVFISACAFFIGGGMWITAAFYLFLVVVAASMLPRHNALQVTGCAIGTFALLVFADVSGAIQRPAFFGIPQYTGNYQLGLITVAVAATTMVLALIVQQTLVAAIRTSQESYRLVLEAASEMIATLDSDTRVILVNDSMARHTGFSRSELLGADVMSLMAPSSHGALAHQLELVRLGSRVPIDGAYLNASGSERWLAGTLTPVPAGEGGAKILLIARDVTSERRAERERDRLRDELSQALRIQALARLVSGVAHELNNPLTAILTTTDDLLDGPLANPDDRESLGIIRQQAHRARAIVRDLIAFVKSGSERKHERILPSTALAESLAAARTQFEPIGARMEVDIEPNMEPLEVDRAGFDQVIANIVMNAAQAAGPGGLVAVRARSTEGVCEIVVEDNGPGIASEVLAHIFEPFYTTKTVGQGSGLGLSLSMGIVQHYKGTIAAENRSYAAEGSSGARFTICLPVAAVLGAHSLPAAATPAAESENPINVAELPMAQAAARSVLVIDDEASIRQSLRRYLERFGWQVKDVSSAVDAMPLLLAPEAAEIYAVIICDIRMPGMTGIELCKRLKADAPMLLSRFVLTSGDLSQIGSEVRDCAVGGTLQKPYDVAELRALVDRVAGAAQKVT